MKSERWARVRLIKSPEKADGAEEPATACPPQRCFDKDLRALRGFQGLRQHAASDAGFEYQNPFGSALGQAGQGSSLTCAALADV